MCIVSNWLNNVGLSYAIPAFRTAGINSPSDLAELQYEDYVTLGVIDSDHRKKLFYLIQRINLEINEGSPLRRKGDANEARLLSESKESSTLIGMEMDDKKACRKAPPQVNQVNGFIKSHNQEVGLFDDRQEISEGVKSCFESSTSKYQVNLLPEISVKAKNTTSLAELGIAGNNEFKENKDIIMNDIRNKDERAKPRKSATIRIKRSQEENIESGFDLYGRNYSVNGIQSSPPSPSSYFVHNVPFSFDENNDKSDGKNEEFSKNSEVSAQQYYNECESEVSENNSISQVNESRINAIKTLGSTNCSTTIYDKENNRNEYDFDSNAEKESETRNSKVKLKRQSNAASTIPPSCKEITNKKAINQNLRNDSLIKKPSNIDQCASLSNKGKYAKAKYSQKKIDKSRFSFENASKIEIDYESHSQASQNGSPSSMSSSSSNNSRSSYIPRSKYQNSSYLRNCKPLSTIPSEKVAHMSPLGKISNTQLDLLSKPRSMKEKRLSAPIYQSSKVSSVRSSSKTHSDATKSRKSTRESFSSSRSSSRRSSSSSSKSSRHSTGSLHSNPLNSDMKERISRNGRKSMNPTYNKRSMCISSKKKHLRLVEKTEDNTSGVIFPHGSSEDDAWATQVSNLREATETAYSQETAKQNFNHPIEDMRIRVVVRKRPISASERVDVIHPINCEKFCNHGKVFVYQPKTRVDLTKEIETMKFSFDNVFDESATNIDIYKRATRNLVTGVFKGEWATVFAYGQTGSGKTFTMMGSGMTGKKFGNRTKSKIESEHNSGLYYLAAKDLLRIANTKYQHLTVGVSLFEIYGGKLFDLLNKRKSIKCLEDHKGKVCFPGLSEHPVSSASKLMELIDSGAKNRSTGSTSANADSSRSHAVLQLCLRKTVGRKQNVEHGRLTFIDLAGSERGADTSQASRTTRLEGAEINTSLLSLKEVIRALATGDSMSHIPFRGSKLTQVLKQSFVGANSRTVMIACVAAELRHCEHTLNTLRYADRVKERDAETGQAPIDTLISMKTQSKMARPSSAPPTSKGRKAQSNHPLESIPGSCLKDKNNIEYELDEDEWSSGSEIQYEDNNFHKKREFLPDESLDCFVNKDDPSYASSLASTTERVERHNVDTCQNMKKEISENTREAVKNLLENHRTCTSGMLSIVKREMVLVDRTGEESALDDYINELESLQEKHLSLIHSLRLSLVKFYAARS